MRSEIIDRTFKEIDSLVLFQLLRLRVDVFVVEQECAYPELDDRDLDSQTRHVWVEENNKPITYLRVLAKPGGGHRIGRVATTPTKRKLGLATRLVDYVIDSTTGLLALDAQAQLEGWYQNRGFITVGEPFDEAGILHVPMAHRRDASWPK